MSTGIRDHSCSKEATAQTKQKTQVNEIVKFFVISLKNNFFSHEVDQKFSADISSCYSQIQKEFDEQMKYLLFFNSLSFFVITNSCNHFSEVHDHIFSTK